MPRISTNEVTKAQFDKLVALVKKSPGESERFYSEGASIPMNQIGKALWRAELAADPSLKIPATPASIAKAADKGNLRWPRIATYAGISVGKAKALYQEHTGQVAPSNLTSRGRRYDGVAPAAKKTASSGRRTAAATQTGTSGRRGAAAKTTAAPAKRGAAAKTAAKPAGRRGTRAGATPR